MALVPTGSLLALVEEPGPYNGPGSSTRAVTGPLHGPCREPGPVTGPSRRTRAVTGPVEAR